MNTLKCEVLVVGAGPAGGMAAKSCAEKGIDTILIEKKPRVSPRRCSRRSVWSLSPSGSVPI